VTGISESELDAVVSAGRSPTGPDHALAVGGDTVFSWDYARSRPALGRLYEKAKASQWNATDDLPWDIDVDEERLARQSVDGPRIAHLRSRAGDVGSEIARWGEAEWLRFAMEGHKAMLSQFLHGEQGALLCTAKIVEQAPWVEGKYYASTQVVDEARHVEVFSRYIDQKLSGTLPINPHLGRLLDDILTDDRWDITYLGMQVMVEGLALAAFGAMRQSVTEPLLEQLLRYVMSDEARHVAFGVLSLTELYQGLDHAELRERQEFAWEATLALCRRWFHTDLWERLGVDPRPMVRLEMEDPGPGARGFRRMLFSKIVPNCRKLGLLDAGDGWLRRRYEELGIIEFEHLDDTGADYEAFDEVARDRAPAR
jgi:hypothetical protein